MDCVNGKINLLCFEKGQMMPMTSELLDELLKDYKSPEDMFGDVWRSPTDHQSSR